MGGPIQRIVFVLLHITTPTEWEAALAAGELTAESLETEGFIHCSTPAQVLIPANERYANRSDLCLLVIDPDALTSRLVFEDSYNTGQEFPHVYGPINPDAIRRVVAFPCQADGTFVLPGELSE